MPSAWRLTVGPPPFTPVLGDLLGELAEKATAALDRAGVSYAICGGVAVALAGRSRSTRDLDVLTVLPEDEMEKFILAGSASVGSRCARPWNFKVSVTTCLHLSAPSQSQVGWLR